MINDIPYAMVIRQEVLTYALLLENYTSVYLAKLLGIKNAKTSRSFSNKASSLSYATKINLLIDIGALDEKTISKYMKFMEIRNQFMHNIEAKTFESCLSFLPGTEKFLDSLYKFSPNLDKEKNLREAINSLAGELVKTTLDIIDKINENEIKSRIHLLNEKFIKKFLTSGELIAEVATGISTKYIKKHPKVDRGIIIAITLNIIKAVTFIMKDIITKIVEEKESPK